MTEQSFLYQKTLKEARDRDPEIDLLLDTTREDTEWLRVARRGADPQTPHDPKT